MRVTHTRRSNITEGRRSVRGSSGRGGQFRPAGEMQAARRRQAAGPAAVGSVDTILALQGIDAPPDRRREAVETGGRILDLLDQLKVDVLSGTVREGDLAILKRTVERQRNVEEDPGLNDVLKQIDLRARVELAKLKRSAA